MSSHVLSHIFGHWRTVGNMHYFWGFIQASFYIQHQSQLWWDISGAQQCSAISVQSFILQQSSRNHQKWHHQHLTNQTGLWWLPHPHPLRNYPCPTSEVPWRIGFSFSIAPLPLPVKKNWLRRRAEGRCGAHSVHRVWAMCKMACGRKSTMAQESKKRSTYCVLLNDVGFQPFPPPSVVWLCVGVKTGSLAFQLFIPIYKITLNILCQSKRKNEMQLKISLLLAAKWPVNDFRSQSGSTHMPCKW